MPTAAVDGRANQTGFWANPRACDDESFRSNEQNEIERQNEAHRKGRTVVGADGGVASVERGVDGSQEATTAAG